MLLRSCSDCLGTIFKLAQNLRLVKQCYLRGKNVTHGIHLVLSLTNLNGLKPRVLLLHR